MDTVEIIKNWKLKDIYLEIQLQYDTHVSQGGAYVYSTQCESLEYLIGMHSLYVLYVWLDIRCFATSGSHIFWLGLNTCVWNTQVRIYFIYSLSISCNQNHKSDKSNHYTKDYVHMTSLEALFESTADT